MKTLKKKLQLNDAKVLSDSEMKKILGGTGTGIETGIGTGTGTGTEPGTEPGIGTQHCVVRCYNYDGDTEGTTTNAGSTCPTTPNFGCTTKYSCCNCTTY